MVLLQGEVTKEGREDTLQAEFLISIPQANLSVYDPTPIANNVENVDSAALAMAITTSIAGLGLPNTLHFGALGLGFRV